VFKKTILTGQYVDQSICRHILTGEPVNRSIPHISFNHVTRFEPITAAHFYQRYNNKYHRLNGSSSHVLTATSRSYGKAKNSTPTESKPLIWLR